MPTIIALFLLPLVFSLFVAYATTPAAIRLAAKIGIIDDPKKTKHPKVIHTYPVPRGGGLPIFTALVVSSLLFLPLDKHLIGILIGAGIICAMGTFDDKYNLNPYLRLVLGLLAAAAPIAAGIGIAFVQIPFLGIINLSQPQIHFDLLGPHSVWVFSDLFALFWIVFLMNMVNMGAKGVDGQLPGVAGIAALTIGLLSLGFSADITQWPVIILAGITAGAYFGFLPWNMYPQKIMPGYGGSTLAGYLLAVLSILSTAKVGTLLVVLGVPLIDTGYTMIRRVASGKSPVWGDVGHLHHRLLALGWSKRKVAVFYWLITGVLGILALNLNASFKFYTMVGVAVALGGALLWLTYRPK
jgi:UDP-GlcNAc:undecaprenyl-phosphate GlcNAc-1-phosphate transferase